MQNITIILTLCLLLIFTGTAKAQAIIEHCGTLTANETWSGNDIHLVTCDITVENGVTLTIEAGAIVKLGTDDSILVAGTFIARGADGNRITFTSYRDDSAGGDTNGDGPSSGAVEDWGRVHFFETADTAASAIEYATFRFGGNDGSFSVDYGAITLTTVAPTFSNLSMSDNHLNGIEVRAGSYADATWHDAGGAVCAYRRLYGASGSHADHSAECHREKRIGSQFSRIRRIRCGRHSSTADYLHILPRRHRGR